MLYIDLACGISVGIVLAMVVQVMGYHQLWCWDALPHGINQLLDVGRDGKRPLVEAQNCSVAVDDNGSLQI